MQKLNKHCLLFPLFGYFAFSKTRKRLFTLSWLIVSSLVFFLNESAAQVTLEPGDVAIIGVNANNNACSGYVGQGEDVITFVAFTDITNNTEIDFTDNGWERVTANRFGDSEGTYRFVRNGGTIAAGNSFNLIFRSNLAEAQTQNPGWTVTNLNEPSAVERNINMASSGDQLFVMQGGNWDNMGATGDHDATYDGRVLYGFNTRTFWAADGTSQQSNLHPDIDPCFHMEPTGGTTNYISYSGPTSSATQLEWIDRIGDVNNWTSYLSCLLYNPPPAFLPIEASGMSISCNVCSGCSPINTDLTFNLPTGGGPFNVVYTDGTNNYNLNGISNGHTENVTVTNSTTFSLVSVSDINNCPVYSNFEGEAVITVTNNGGDASITGGGVLCTDNCDDVTFLITGGQAPYEVTVELDVPPFINNFQFDVTVPNTNFTITICIEGVLPFYDVATNTLSIPFYLGSNATLTLISMTDATNCQGNVDSTPLNFDIYETPEANPAGPLAACDDGSGQATFDLTSLNNTVNGNTGNTVDWYTDMATTNPIGNPSNYQSASTTVYATASTNFCTSEPVAVDLIVDPVPSANPASDEACADATGQATFDLTSLDFIVNGGSGDPVNWYSDPGGNSPIPNPGNYTTTGGFVYAAVSNGNCESPVVTITLTVNPSPGANPASDMACDEGGGIATFDLTTLDNTVNGGSGNPVSWFTDPGGTIPVNNPANYTTTGGSVYATVSNGQCSSPPVEVILTVNPSPTANPTSDSACDEGGGLATFDLTSLDNTVNGGNGNPVSWYLDNNATAPVPNPANYTTPGGSVFAVVSNGICESQPVEIFLNVSPAPTANSASDSACDNGNGTATFDLTSLNDIVNGGSGNPVNWYLDPLGNNTIPNPTNYTSGNGSVYASVDNGFCESPLVEVFLTVNPAPTANTANASQCEDSPGQATFDLTLLDDIVNGGSGNPVSWYFDPGATSAIPDPTNFTSGTGSVFAVVNDGLCSSLPVEVFLDVPPAPESNNADATSCEESPGQATFDLTLLDNIVNGGNAQTVIWYTDPGATNTIPDPTNYTTGSGFVYAVVDNGTCISQVAEITLTVTPAPEANPASDFQCGDQNGEAIFDLTSLDNTVNGGSGFPVEWYLDAGASNPVPNPGNYLTGSTSVYAIVVNGNCVSEIVEITLSVDDQPAANPASLEACDDGSGTAPFDLTTLEDEVNGGTGNTVNWYSDPGATTPINNPENYISSGETVYAVVGDGNCTSEVVEIILILNNQPNAVPTNDEACADPNGTATFDLTTLDQIVNDGTNNPVNWFEDILLNNPITGPFTTTSTTVYATVGEGDCVSGVVGITLTVLSAPEVNPATAEECDTGNGTATFDLTGLENTVNGGSGNQVNWYEDANGTISIASPYTTATTIVYANVEDGTACPSGLVEVNLNVLDLPEANPTSADECDTGNGEATFNLSGLENTVNGGSGNTVLWFEDAGGTISISSPYTSGSTTIYAQVIDANCSSELVAITLNVGDAPAANPAEATACDSGNGEAIFDLNTIQNLVNGGTANPVNWFEDMAGTIPVTSPYTSVSTTIYANVGSGNCISPIVEITLSVEDLPVANPASADECDSGNGEADFDLTLLENTVNGGSGNPVSWFEDMAGTIPVTSPYTSASTLIYASVTEGNCNSELVEVTLNVGDAPQASPATAEACDEGSGEAAFNLTLLENIVNNGTSNPVNWFEDMAATIPITSPYNTATTTIFANVGSGDCLSEIVEIELTINDTPMANPAAADECADGSGTATFDLSTLENTVNGGTANAVSWFEDIAGTIPLASPYTGSSTTIYAQVSNGICTSDFVAITLTVNDLPVANPTSADECDNGSGTATFDLTSLENIVNGGTTNTVSWFEDMAGTIPVSSPYTTSATTIFANVTNGDCVSEVVEIMLNVSNTVSANPASATECDNGNAQADFDLTALESTVNGGSGNTVNWFEDAGGTISITSPYTSGSTSIYANVGSGNCVSALVEIILTVENTPLANPAVADECDSGNGEATFDLSLLENTVNGGTGNTVNWFEDANGTIPVTSPYTSSTTTLYANVDNGSCTSELVEIELNVGNSPVAFATSDNECDNGNGEAAFDLTALENTVNGGTASPVNWFEDAGGTLPIASPYTTASTTVYASVGSGDCISDLVEIILNVDPLPVAIPTAADECDSGNGEATFDLTSLENTVNGGTGNTVNWFEDANGTTPITPPYTTGSTSVYAMVSDANCSSEIVEIILNVGGNPVAIPAAASECDSGNGTATFDLNDLENTVNGGTANPVNWFEDAGGTISITSPYTTGTTTIYANVGDGACISETVEIVLTVDPLPVANTATIDECDSGNGEASFDLFTIESMVNNGTTNPVAWFEDAGGTVLITSPYTSSTNTIFAIVSDGVCNSPAVAIDLNIISLPDAFSAAMEECDSGNGEAIFNLNSLENTVNGGTANTVEWYLDTDATFPISSPFTTSGTTIFATVNDGSCTSQTVPVSLQVNDLPAAFSAIDNECDSGNGEAVFDLNSLENTVNGGTANTVSWYADINGTNAIASPYTSNSGSVYAVVSDGNCSSFPVEVNLIVDALPEAFPATAQECDDGNGTANFDLTSLEAIVNGGSTNAVNWFEDAQGNLPILNTNYTASQGTIYAQTTDNQGCTSDLIAVDLEILSPISNTLNFQECHDFSIMINGTTYDGNNLTGTEIIAGGASNGCDSIINVTLDLFEPVIGSIAGDVSICEGSSATISFDLSGAGTYDVTYSDGINPQVVLSGISDGHTISVSPNQTTTYTLQDVVGIGVPCSATIPSNTVTVTVSTISAGINVLSDYNGFAISCNDANDGEIEAIPFTGNPPFTYQWNNGASTAINSSLAAGMYSVTVTDALGCTTETGISLDAPEAISISAETGAPDCFGDSNGTLFINAISGGSGNYQYSLDGDIFQPIFTIPFEIFPVPPGSYILEIVDDNACAASQTLVIADPPVNTIDLGEDVEITLGETVQFDPDLNFVPEIIIWDQVEMSCTECLDPIVMPFETTTYSIIALDANGCEARDEITVKVRKSRSVFIPSAFSPNGDGANDYFYPFAGANVAIIHQFKVFSRWGEVLYSIDNIDPNDYSVGWNGEFKGQRMNPGVYVYLIEVEFVDGQIRLFKGDVTLMK